MQTFSRKMNANVNKTEMEASESDSKELHPMIFLHRKTPVEWLFR